MAKNETFIRRLIEILVSNKSINADLAKSLPDLFSRSSIDEFDEFLLHEGFVQKDELLPALGVYYNVPPLDVTGQFFDCVLLKNFPEDFLVRSTVIPLEEDEDMLCVVAADPERDGLESEIRNFTKNDITFKVGIRQDIIDAIREYYDPSVTEVPDDVDIHQEHSDEMSARNQILEEQDGVIQDMTDEDSIQ